MQVELHNRVGSQSPLSQDMDIEQFEMIIRRHNKCPKHMVVDIGIGRRQSWLHMGENTSMQVKSVL